MFSLGNVEKNMENTRKYMAHTHITYIGDPSSGAILW